MNQKELINDFDSTLIPREFKHLLIHFEPSELGVLTEIIAKNSFLKKTPYMTFCKYVLEIALVNLGFHPKFEYLAANIAFEIRKFDKLELLVTGSKNYYLLIPYIRGLVAQNNLEKAVEKVKAIENVISPDDMFYQLELYIAKSELAQAQGNLTDALFHLLSAKEFLSASNNELDILYLNTLTTQIIINECQILFSMGRYNKSSEILNQGLTLAKTIDNKILTALLELLYGTFMIESLYESDTGNQHHRRAAAIARSLMNPYLIAKTLETIGINLQLQKNIDDGIEFCQHAEQMYKKMGDEQGRMNVAIKIASLYIITGNISAATNILLDLESLGNSDPKIYLNLTEIYINNDELELAEVYLEKARKYLRGRGDLQGEFFLMYYEGLIELYSGNFSKAELLFTNAQEFADLSKLTKLFLLANIELAWVLVIKNIALPSKRNFRNAEYAIIVLSKQIKKDGSVIEYNNLELLKAILLFSNKDYLDAEKIFQKLHEFYTNVKLHEKIRITQDYLKRISNLKAVGATREEHIIKNTFSEFEIPSQYTTKTVIKSTNSLIDLGAHPILLLILSQNGLPLYSQYFTQGFGRLDETLVSGLLGAIISFAETIGESTKDTHIKPGFLQSIRHGDFEILLERTDRYILALVADKAGYLIRKQLKRLAEELNMLFLSDDEPIIVLGEKNRLYIEAIVKRIF